MVKKYRIEYMANDTSQTESLKKVSKLLEQFVVENEPVVKTLKEETEGLGDAADSVDQSWSQSSIGYHGSYYYGDFDQVPSNNRWSKEWGTIHGVPSGWRSRNGDEVKAEIEKRASGLKIKDFSSRTESYLKSAKKLKEEIEIELSDFIFSSDMSKEKELFDQLEKYDFGDIDQLRADYINSRIGGSKISRDVSAMTEGTYIPSQMTTVAGISAAEHFMNSIKDFVQLGERFIRQTEKKIGVIKVSAINPESDSITKIMKIINRFHLVARQLLERHGGRETLCINDEYDVQDLLHSLLRIDFDDVRSEEWTPSYAGSSSRMDFLLKNEEIVVEVKKTNPGLRDKQVGEQLILDIAHYKSHKNCKILICFVYDPDSLIKNRSGLINDLQKVHDGLDVKIVFTP